ncbi:MAG: DUF5723 family protein [Bacteroidales bacterium]|nr:DUF5723 family protein [Bacteroidales bacterium]
MKRLKKAIVATVCSILFFVHIIIAQNTPVNFEASGTGATTTLATDYQSLGVNPANLGYPQNGRMIHFSLLETGFSLTSDAITRKGLWQTFVSKNINDFTLQDKKNAAALFGGAGFLMDANINLASFSIQNKKLGGIGFVIRDRMSNMVKFNDKLAELIFLGKDAPYFQNAQPLSLDQLFKDSRISGNWYREIMLGYGRRLLKLPGIKLYVGADIKYILGYGNLNIYSDDKDGFFARSAITPFAEVKYDASTPTALSKSGFKPVGHGWGIDMGATARLLDVFKVGIAFNDLGSITWDAETYEAPNIQVDSISSSGFDSYQFLSEIKTLFLNNHMLQWQGTGKYTTGLPAHLKLGASFNPAKWFEVGVDMYAPLNDHAANLDKAIYSAGGFFRLGSLAKISVGYVDGDIYENNVPVGLAFGIRNWEMGMATGDVLTFFRHKQPTLSIGTGFLRFKFGPA